MPMANMKVFADGFVAQVERDNLFLLVKEFSGAFREAQSSHNRRKPIGTGRSSGLQRKPVTS
jgi:hypothetical protein